MQNELTMFYGPKVNYRTWLCIVYIDDIMNFFYMYIFFNAIP